MLNNNVKVSRVYTATIIDIGVLTLRNLKVNNLVYSLWAQQWLCLHSH